ncbi:hypothetical protein M1523_03775 [Patescibacteria group bacterium]|nr:hypothetical protein [Patescibacteria group bacterium]MCL5091813.1 hypothetical protein [Patescibacteria group bacterium]
MKVEGPYQLSLVVPKPIEPSEPFFVLQNGTMIFQHCGPNAEGIGKVPPGYTLWISRPKTTPRPGEHQQGHVIQIYKGWEIVRIVKIGTATISAGTPVYY